METRDTKLPYLDIFINKKRKKVFMDIYSKTMDSKKRYASFKSNRLKHCLKNIPFSLALRICMTTENNYLTHIMPSLHTQLIF